MALPTKNRIKSKKDLDQLFKKGTTVKGAFLFIKYIKNNLQFSRFIVIVSARLYKKSSSRNRIKRIINEQLKLSLDNIENGYDILISVKNRAEEDCFKRDLPKVLEVITY